MALTLDQGLKIIALCERIGMPWEWHPGRDPHAEEFAWNGKFLNLAHHSPNGTSDMVHEIAHWIVAAPARRDASDFGLEAPFVDPEFQEDGEEEAAAIAQAEEELASVLGILIERHLGFDWRYTWRFHSWDRATSPTPRSVINTLRRRGHLHRLTPACLMPTASSRQPALQQIAPDTGSAGE